MITKEQFDKDMSRGAMTSTKERLAEFSALKDGWYDGYGDAITAVSLARARKWLRWLPDGYVYPLPEGGVQWEYDMHNWCVSISFDARGRVAAHFVEIEHK